MDSATRDKVGALYRDHHAWLTGWINRRLDCRDQANDLAQETFVRVITQRRELNPHSPRAYLSSIARNLLVDMFRRRSIEKAYLETLANQPEPVDISPQTRHSIVEVLLEIDRLLDSMNDRSREIFLLAQIDGLSYVEISRRLDVSVNTVRKHFIRALSGCLAVVEE